MHKGIALLFTSCLTKRSLQHVKTGLSQGLGSFKKNVSHPILGRIETINSLVCCPLIRQIIIIEEVVCDEARQAAALPVTDIRWSRHPLLHNDLHGLPQPERVVAAQHLHGLASDAHIVEDCLLQHDHTSQLCFEHIS